MDMSRHRPALLGKGKNVTNTDHPAVASLRACGDHLLQAVLDASAAAASITLDAPAAGARAARAQELLNMLDAAISHCDRLAVVVEGDARAGVTL